MLAVAINDPFGLATRTKVTLQGAFDRVVGTFYSGEAAKNIAIIEATYPDAISGKAHLPIYYSELAQIIDLAQQAHAKAVFLDYEFSLPPDPRDDLEQLVDAIKDAKRARVPVFTGTIGADPALAPLKGVVQQVAVRGSTDHPADYSLNPDLDGRLSPAVALYRVLCDRPRTDRPPQCDDRLLRHMAQRKPMPDLAMQMGGPFPEEQARYVSHDVTAHCRAGNPLSELFAGVSGVAPGDPCPRHLTISAGAALTDGYAKQLAEDLKGRVIVVGPGLELGDDHDWPGVGRVPGALFHVTALDNLLTWRSGYRHWPSAIFPVAKKFGWDDAVGLALIFITPALVLNVFHWVPPPPPSPAHRKRRSPQQVKRSLGQIVAGVIIPAKHPTGDTDRVRRGLAFRALGAWIGVACLPTVAAGLFFFSFNWAPACAISVLAIGLPLCTTICGEELARRLHPLDNWQTAINFALASGAVLAILILPAAWALTVAGGLLIVLFARLAIGLERILWRARHRQAVQRHCHVNRTQEQKS